MMRYEYRLYNLHSQSVFSETVSAFVILYWRHFILMIYLMCQHIFCARQKGNILRDTLPFGGDNMTSDRNTWILHVLEKKGPELLLWLVELYRIRWFNLTFSMETCTQILFAKTFKFFVSLRFNEFAFFLARFSTTWDLMLQRRNEKLFMSK